MDKKKALQKLRRAKQEALRNSSCIQVGRLELNEYDLPIQLYEDYIMECLLSRVN